MDKSIILEKLKDDEHYYGEFGQQFLSNSNIKTLMSNPKDLRKPMPKIPAFLVGGYFHTAILEPEKLGNFETVDAKSRNSKVYKDAAKGDIIMLEQERVQADSLVAAMKSNEVCANLINPLDGDVEYEVPGVAELMGNMWKGKADILNHTERLVVDLKTTSDINKFRYSASKYNYDSQAYIYRELFGYEMLFVVIDKSSKQIGLYDCSEEFYQRGREKVLDASAVYDQFYKDENFNADQHLLTDTL